MTWSMDQGDQLFTADEARRFLHDVLPDRDLVGKYWDHLVRIDKAIGIRPPLTWGACLAQRDGVMQDRELWESLNDTLRAWMVVLDDNEIDALVAMIVENAVAHYALPDDDDDGDWSLRARDTGRVLTKAEAVPTIIHWVINGERQEILERLADWSDEFKTMLAAIPLQSESATLELVRTVVKEVVADQYCEKAA